MSAADTERAVAKAPAGPANAAESARAWSKLVRADRRPTAAVSHSPRFLRSELRMVFGRRRNQIALAVLACVPLLLAIVIKVADPTTGGDGPPFIDRVTHSGVFVAFTSLAVVMAFFLPLAVSVVAGDSIAGEAGTGTLRYLLTVPVSRTRLLAVKYAGIVAYCVAATLLVAAVGAAIGLILFPANGMNLLSGAQVGLGTAFGRLVLVALYVAASMAAIGAIGLFVSTLVESSIAAMTATAGAFVLSEVLDTIPQIDVIHPYLPSHWWLQFGDLLRDPIATSGIASGLATVVAYAALFGALAWARFSGKDVSS